MNNRFTPMRVGRIKPICDRTGRQSSAYQFIRELWTNTVESEGDRAVIHPEWGAAETIGVYRFCYVDNGSGMSSGELLGFLNQFGGGGKAIGGQHENYGIGAKSSTLPGNHAGMIVASRKDGETSAIVLAYDESSDEYGVVSWLTLDEDDDALVLEALDLDAQDRDFELVDGTTVGSLLDTFIHKTQGTITVLCGMTGDEHTYLSTGEGADFTATGPVTGIATYVNQRFWDPGGRLSVYEPASDDVDRWPSTRAEAGERVAESDAKSTKKKSTKKKRKAKGPVPVSWRRPAGLADFLENGDAERGQPEASGSVTLSDGTVARWYLLGADDEYSSRLSSGGTFWGGGIATLYQGELYDIDSGSRLRRLRDFGVTRDAVARRVTIVLEPPPSDESTEGVYPTDSRSQLLWTGGKRLPWSRWGNDFYKNLPPEIETAMAVANQPFADFSEVYEVDDEAAEGFLKRAKRYLYLVHDGEVGPTRALRKTVVAAPSKADTTTKPGAKKSTGASRSGAGNGAARSTSANKRASGSKPRVVAKRAGAMNPVGLVGDGDEGVDGAARVALRKTDPLPKVHWLTAENFETSSGPVAASFDTNRSEVDANIDYALFREIVEHYRMTRPILTEEEILLEVKRVYSMRLGTYVAHTQMQRKSGILSAERAKARLSDETLTAVCDGMLVEDLSINRSLTELEDSKLARRRGFG